MPLEIRMQVFDDAKLEPAVLDPVAHDALERLGATGAAQAWKQTFRAGRGFQPASGQKDNARRASERVLVEKSLPLPKREERLCTDLAM